MPIRIPGAGEEEGGGGPTPRGPMVTTISLDALNPRQQLFDLPPGLAISTSDALNRLTGAADRDAQPDVRTGDASG